MKVFFDCEKDRLSGSNSDLNTWKSAVIEICPISPSHADLLLMLPATNVYVAAKPKMVFQMGESNAK